MDTKTATTFKVYQTAFARDNSIEPNIRLVKVPTEKLTGTEKDLDEIYYYGQNDFCQETSITTKFYSTSVGDIIEFNNELYLVADYGFIKRGDQGNPGISIKIDLEYANQSGRLHPMIDREFGYLVPECNRKVKLVQAKKLNPDDVLSAKWADKVVTAYTSNGFTTVNTLVIDSHKGESNGERNVLKFNMNELVGIHKNYTKELSTS